MMALGGEGLAMSDAGRATANQTAGLRTVGLMASERRVKLGRKLSEESPRASGSRSWPGDCGAEPRDARRS